MGKEVAAEPCATRYHPLPPPTHTGPEKAEGDRTLEAGLAGSLVLSHGVSRCQWILPSWIFFHASEAVKMQESRIPATVKVPPMMAQICKGARGQSVPEISAREAPGGAPPASQADELTHEDTHCQSTHFACCLLADNIGGSKKTTCWMMN